VIFGIWPGAVAADLVTLEPLDCPPEDPARTLAALRRLQGPAEEFYVRAYRHFAPGGRPRPGTASAPARPELYAGEGRLIDLVACYRSPAPDPAGFAGFVRQAVRDVAAWGGGKVQVGEELNVPAPLDGGSPGCFAAVGAGVAAALDERDHLAAAPGGPGRGAAPVLIGVNAAGFADPDFWEQLTGAIGPGSTRRLDFVGLDAFPDVFRPIARPSLPGAVSALLERFRTVTTAAGVPAAVPIHLTETGWPTGGERTEPAQADILAAVADAVLASDTGVAAYEWFGLRDGLTAGGWTTRFGVLRDDYTAKPAFAVLQRLIAQQLGVQRCYARQVAKPGLRVPRQQEAATLGGVRGDDQVVCPAWTARAADVGEQPRMVCRGNSGVVQDLDHRHDRG
jgi:hypothetical protein